MAEFGVSRDVTHRRHRKPRKLESNFEWESFPYFRRLGLYRGADTRKLGQRITSPPPHNPTLPC